MESDVRVMENDTVAKNFAIRNLFRIIFGFVSLYAALLTIGLFYNLLPEPERLPRLLALPGSLQTPPYVWDLREAPGEQPFFQLQFWFCEIADHSIICQMTVSSYLGQEYNFKIEKSVLTDGSGSKRSADLAWLAGEQERITQTLSAEWGLAPGVNNILLLRFPSEEYATDIQSIEILGRFKGERFRFKTKSFVSIERSIFTFKD